MPSDGQTRARAALRVPPLNVTADERRTLIHCILAGEDEAVSHFGRGERERIESIKQKLGYPSDGVAEPAVCPHCSQAHWADDETISRQRLAEHYLETHGDEISDSVRSMAEEVLSE